jgi:hypothetical protein
MADWHELQIGDSVVYHGKPCEVTRMNRDGTLNLEELPGGCFYNHIDPGDVRLTEYPNPEDN